MVFVMSCRTTEGANRYTAIAGATWAESIVRTLFGYQPQWPVKGGGDGCQRGGAPLWMAELDRMVEATLSGMSTPCGLVSITAGSKGVQYTYVQNELD
jgi:hypothetical protein